jgi:hypothetical protein
LAMFSPKATASQDLPKSFSPMAVLVLAFWRRAHVLGEGSGCWSARRIARSQNAREAESLGEYRTSLWPGTRGASVVGNGC